MRTHPIQRRRSSAWLILAALVTSGISAVAVSTGEIYYGITTPTAISAVSEPAADQDRQVLLRGVFAVGLPDAGVAGEIRLSQASISPTTASPMGYSSFHTDALLAGKRGIEGNGLAPQRTAGAAEYRYGFGQDGSAALWKIQFEAVPEFDESEQNFFPAMIETAVTKARMAIRANPFHKGPGSGYALLFQAAYESTVPYTYAGNEWRAKADRDRIGVTPTLANVDDRLDSLRTSAERFREACEPFLAFLNHPVESAYLLDPDFVIARAGPDWSPERRTWSGLLFQSYVQALSNLGDSRFEYYYTRYFKEFRPPGTGGFNVEALIAEIHASADEIDRLMLPVSALASVGVLDVDIETATPASHSALLRRLADHVRERAIFFSPGINPFSGKISHSTYGHNYVPFLVPAQLASRPFSFDNFLAFTFGIAGADVPPLSTTATADSLIGGAKAAEAVAFGAIEQVIQTVEQVEQLREETRSTYESQLAQLCGQLYEDPNDPTSALVPDLLGYLLPPEERALSLPGETLGDISLAWNKIDQAQTRLLSAYRALAEVDEEAQIIREYGNKRLLSYDRIARIQLQTGEEISALDFLSGEIRANAISQEAEARARAATKRSWFSAAFKWAVHAVAAVYTGGASLTWSLAIEAGADAAAALDQAYAAKTQAQLHREVGRIQADATRRQAAIDAQRTRIRSTEGAKITMEQAGQEEDRIMEAIHKLMIRVERQKLEILMAQQALDFADIEHANLIGRIGYLLQEYRRVSVRQAASTLNRPDVRLRRDYEIREAERKFRVAQEYAYLCAKAAHYRFAGQSSHPFRTEVSAELHNILRAQNATQLEAAVSELVRIRGAFLNATGGLASLHEVRFSIRDLIAQSNHWLAAFYRGLDGTWTGELEGFELQGFPQTIVESGGSATGVSDAHFIDFLTRNLHPVADGTGSSVLRLRFPIGFEPQFQDRLNPIRTSTSSEYGHVIVGPGPSYATASAVGVFVNIRNNRSVNPVGLMPAVASLKPIGAFYTTAAPHGSPTSPINPASLRLWSPSQVDGESALNSSVLVVYNKDTLAGAWANRFPELTLGSAGSQLHERSPANDHWVLELIASDSAWNVFLPNMRDIEICMTIRGWSN